jgi:ubiquinone/menaquinone biosynthesis C-methylase UbiE/uncharacterized protein YbaR (Trm112 family)
MLKPNTMQEERHYQRESTLRQRQHYLDSDVLAKVRDDDGYRQKVEMIERSLKKASASSGWILDIGAGTCGEDEYLSTKGFRIICTDVNDVALAVSRERTERYGRPLLKYVACDGQNLPFFDGSISAVLFNESLHHMPNARASIAEVARVLEPGGLVCLLEPYAYDPWRRISEIRDYFKGSIEKSFSVTQLRRILVAAGLDPISVERPIYLSRSKLNRLPTVHRIARKIYYDLRELMPSLLGMILMTATKASGEKPKNAPAEFDDMLRCPITKSSLARVANGYATTGRPQKFVYPVVHGIPVLIPDEAKSM